MTKEKQNPDRILVVDDEPHVCDILKKILEEENYTVFTAISGARALNFLKKESIDLILLDVKMPRMGGIEFLQKVRQSDKSVAVIILTAHATLGTAREAMELGAYDYITKPFDARFVISMVKEGLEEGGA